MSITQIATLNKTQTYAGAGPNSITVNCATGGDWSVDPAAGDLMVMVMNYGDNSTLPGFTAFPGTGWTALDAAQRQENSNQQCRQIITRFATSPEATYTWTAGVNGQAGGEWILQGFCLRGVANPLTFDPAGFSRVNQADAAAQTTPNATVAAVDSVLIGTWSQNWGGAMPAYTAAGTLGTSVPTLLVNTASTANNEFLAAAALWLAPVNGAWAPTVTRSAAPGGSVPGTWGSYRVGLRVSIASPQRTLVGTGT